jgi:hypothetical protein
LPGRNGLNASATALTKCLSGKNQPTWSSQRGSVTTKTSEMNASRMSPPLAMAWVAPGVGARDTTASPRAAKQATPTAIVTITAGSVRHTMSTS